jgi:glycosyltransferase involved in cell wall biosynthesis|tara:strand:- start:502 stop:1260 length:759 start_codon:yes stop_codon:yes gene_type:complete
MDISVISITARKDPGLFRLVESLRRQDFKGKFEFIFCDRLYDERHEEIENVLKKSGLNYKYLADRIPIKGPSCAAARNQCVEAATGKYILNVDDLCVVPSDTLSLHWNYYMEGFDAVAGSYEVFEGGDAPDSRRSGEYLVDDTTIHLQFWGLHVGFTKAVWEKVNGYNEIYDGVYGMEDIDFGMRLGKTDASFRWAPEIRVMCDKGPSHVPLHTLYDIQNPETSWSSGDYCWRNDKLFNIWQAIGPIWGMRR